jgi:hypothetical protein
MYVEFLIEVINTYFKGTSTEKARLIEESVMNNLLLKKPHIDAIYERTKCIYIFSFVIGFFSNRKFIIIFK